MSRGRVVVLTTNRQERYLLAAGVLREAGVPFFDSASLGDGLRLGPSLVRGSGSGSGGYEIEVPLLVEKQARALLEHHRIPASDMPGDVPGPVVDEGTRRFALIAAGVAGLLTLVGFLILTR